MSETNKAIWIWSEGNPKDIIKKGYIEAGEKCKDIGDFSQFETIDELKQAIYDLKGWAENRLSIAYWQIMHEVSIGDIIVINNNIAVKGNRYQHNLYGWGEVVSNCIYTTEGNNRIKRNIKWHLPLLENPVIADKMTNNIFFHKTTLEEAEQIKKVLFTNSRSMIMNNRLRHYIDLLKANHNIIFNGAPGTGKTYLAKKIAEEMGATYKMVQFHPSYDYTDFVEGLRPVKDDKGNIGFERKDGVFKEFCKEALKANQKETQDTFANNNFTDAQIEQAIELFKKEMNGKEIPSYRNAENNFGIVIEGKNIYVIPTSYLTFANKESKKQYVSTPAIIRFIKTGVFNKFSMSYEPSVGQYIKKHYLQKGEQPIYNSIVAPQKKTSPFVFIIDEINRGEISKIFGELFYSIDPGYRGEKGKVQTQYQNLVEDGDVFKDGFYVPENVYIIGTMNDIDRSVESMDFAMRRRFAWQEITAEESAENMGITGELRERMDSLNKVILETEGLGNSYQIGAAMFLKVKETEENVEGNCGMTVESLWNLNLKSLLKEYLRGLPNADNILKEMEDAYFLRNENI